MFSAIKRRLFKKGSKAPPSFQFAKDNTKYKKYSIGEGTYGNPSIKDWGDGGTLYIGKYCSIASNVIILLGGQHSMRSVSTYPFFSIDLILKGENDKRATPDKSSKGDVNIGSDVWIGLGATILSGVTIGDGAIIGAQALVAKDVPPYAVVAGNPFRIIKYRFSESQIESLLKIKWWDWDTEKIKNAEKELMTQNIDEFIEKYKI